MDGDAPPPPPPPPEPEFALPEAPNAVPPFVPTAPAVVKPPPAPPAARYCSFVPEIYSGLRTPSPAAPPVPVELPVLVPLPPALPAPPPPPEAQQRLTPAAAPPEFP